MTSASPNFGMLDRGHVLAAIQAVDQGQPNNFAESTKFDLIYLGRRYPPKRIAGMALQLMTGQPYGPKAFKGGVDTACFGALRRCGFTLIEKLREPSGRSLRDTIGEVLELQKSYQSTNTPQMQRRGALIRNEIPNQLREVISVFEPTFSRAGYACEIEGSDGVGRKNESPWVRIYDPELSPSATQGWYIVLHFSRLGDFTYLTIGCGATVFDRGSLVDVPSTELANRVAWARGFATENGLSVADFGSEPKLHGNHLSGKFEQAIAFAKAYSTEHWDESAFLSDLTRISTLLVRIYDAERFGKDPVAGTVEDQLVAQLDGVLNPGRRKGQGRGLSKAEQTAVEHYAMAVARRSLQDAGFDSIKDTSEKFAYDYSAKRDGKSWFVEVKGTTSTGSDVILLTANELKLHRENMGSTALIIVSGIILDRIISPPSAAGGEIEIFAPWDPEEWEYAATAFRATRKK
ncbi:MrcB family domain-containing protein [Arenimonas donghaensis]|uniref:MrcB family domain-containing protein n=1 Tax=Arenimonas donghaensis TaxID=375061 RepID=UPI000A049D88|nr:DUF3578 domain-containing protein [Arenimonas donghaensis]